jgi:uncharacterized ion transporter superfamily protein YfcC
MSKPSRFPDTLVLIFGLVILAQLLTYFLPAGTYVREPDPAKGDAFVDAPEVKPLRERLIATRTSRGLSEKAAADLFAVSKRTVERWELGPDAAAKGGIAIEANAGAVLHAWILSNEKPSADAIKAWKSSVEARQVLVPKSYTRLEENEALPWHAAFTSIPRGLERSADIIFFVFLIGGVLGMMRATGAFDALIGASIRAFGGRALPLILGSTTMFAIGSGLIGMAEEYVPFIALLVTMTLAMKLDAMLGIAIVLVGYAVGYGCAPVNPFTVLVAQGIAEIDLYSGWWYRALLLVASLIVGVHHLLRYAKKVKADPSKSLVADVDYSTGFKLPEDVKLTVPRQLVLLSFAGSIFLVVWGVGRYGWGFTMLSSVFLGLGFITPFLARIPANTAAKHFCAGAAELTTTALLIGFARTIEVILVDGQIIDTVVQGIAGTLDGLGAAAGSVGMLVVQTLCNFFIPSGSGQAYVTMPIMAPLADELGIERQVAVLAYQFGDGFTNVITPTNAAMMGMLAIARVPYERWLRFVIPLMIKLYLLATVALVAAVWFGYS